MFELFLNATNYIRKKRRMIHQPKVSDFLSTMSTAAKKNSRATRSVFSIFFPVLLKSKKYITV